MKFRNMSSDNEIKKRDRYQNMDEHEDKRNHTLQIGFFFMHWSTFLTKI